MDEAARLVSELHDKLAELDGKVAAYQCGMLAEFHKHMDDCLKQYPDHISTEVSRAITASVAAGRYPALNPPSRDAPDSPAIDRPSWDDRKTSPPPFLRHTSGTPKETARDPHAREKEFQGLFTPAFLPLLESGNRALHSPPMSPPRASNGQALSRPPDNVSQMDESGQAGTPSSSAHEGSRPRPARSLTDRSTSSVESCGSDSKTRRSALRRSSSSAKGSPRRVRFDFEGEEVFPASSSPQAPAPTPGAESGAKRQAEAEPPVHATRDDSTAEYTGPSLLDVEGEEDLLPKPKKVSSTQALQALSRCPLDEGTTWRLVSPDSGELPTSKNGEDEAAKTNGMDGEKQPENAAGLPDKSDSQVTLRATGDGQGFASPQPDPPPPRESFAIDDDGDNAASESDEEFLSIPSRRKSSSPAKQSPFTPPPKPPAAAARNTPASETDGSTTAADDDGLDPLFDFDEDAGSTSSRTQKHQKYLPEAESSDEDSISGRLRQAARQELRQQQPHQPQQAGEPSSSPSPSSPSPSSAVRIPPVSPSTALFEHSIGSYMGRSVTAAPIKDPKLYDEIAGMKDVPFLVGSVHDVSEAEAAKLGSYRVSSSMGRRLAGAAPRSFTERLALEEEMERRRAAGEGGDEEEDDL
ncbi:uncharacterized protein P884DRAFT_273911 [Thermothelomyces heterothallicus CBS 202.75]|uniref:uncharacterized protein n=1 Tax=Thermothelomyces heterothallicus CBS 202.75 TaxID=1149848 RepID=UPI0037444EDF